MKHNQFLSLTLAAALLLTGCGASSSVASGETGSETAAPAPHAGARRQHCGHCD